MIFESISHVEDLPVQDFIQALRNFGDFEISEKIDGSNMQFGFDEQGFYTSREDKGGNRVRSVDEYPVEFKTTFLRSAHLALSQVETTLRKFMKEGDRIEVEILYGELPNAVVYTADSNRIVFLRNVEGNTDLDKLRSALGGKTVVVDLTVPYTVDGKTINTVEESNIWTFAKTPTIELPKHSKEELASTLSSQLDELEAYLLQDSGLYGLSNAEVLSIPLNKKSDKVPAGDWQEAKNQIKAKREEISSLLYSAESGLVAKVKETLLNKLVRQTQSAFGPEITNGGWIEGVVLRHKNSGDMIKIVDKSWFTEINKFNHMVRNSLTLKPRNADDLSSASFIGNLLIQLASASGHPKLGTTGAKSYIRALGATDTQHALSLLASGIDANELKQSWIAMIEQSISKLHTLKSNYDKEKESLKLDLDGDRTFTYNPAIDKRTLETFASLFKMLDSMLQDVQAANSAEDLINILVGDKVNEVV